MTEPDESKRSEAGHKAAIRHSIFAWVTFLAGTAVFFAAADAIFMN